MDQQCFFKQNGYSLFEQNQMTAEERAWTIDWIQRQAQKQEEQAQRGQSHGKQELPADMVSRLGH
jgi:hypothetical protein